MTTGWVLLILAAKLTGADLSGDKSSAFLFYYWNATTHFMLLCMFYASCIEQARTRVHIQHDTRGTPVRAHEVNDNMAHAYPGIAVINPEILFNAQCTTEHARLYIDTCCSISIVNSASQLINVLNIHPINVQG
eukprot:3067240-Rhodomonas_salina.1